MPVDPQVQILLDQMAAVGGPHINEVSVEEAREMLRNLSMLSGEGPPVADVTDRKAGSVPVRVYRPEGDALPILVWYHGGGWVIGDLGTADATCRELATRAGCVVVSVDYRLAPEHPFPTGIDDVWEATCWVAEHGAELGGDPARLAIGGDSAGGNLAAVVAHMAKDRGGPAIAFQLLVYPPTDLRLGHPSMDENAEGYVLTKDSMLWFRAHYVGGNEADILNPFASPLLAGDQTGLPPALVITAEYDPLRDEGEAYGKALEEAGVPVKVHRYEGQIHGFFGMAGMLDGGKQALDEASAALRDALQR